MPAERALPASPTIPAADGVVTCGAIGLITSTHDVEKPLRTVKLRSAKYIFCAEFFAQTQEAVTWRGEEGLLHRNDYGGLLLDRFPDLELIDYGFWWRRVTNGGDCTWWLFRKRHG